MDENARAYAAVTARRRLMLRQRIGEVAIELHATPMEVFNVALDFVFTMARKLGVDSDTTKAMLEALWTEYSAPESHGARRRST